GGRRLPIPCGRHSFFFSLNLGDGNRLRNLRIFGSRRSIEEELEDFGSDAGFDLIAADVEGEIQADAALTEVVPDVP
ncbi:hypothetical protein ACC705_35810, partial [Rhizobium ruizarguesonis]